jgi:hypothetical protein
MITKAKTTIQCKDLIFELNLDYLSEEKQEELINEMSGVIYDRVILRVLGMLTEEEALSLTKLLEEGKEFEAGEILSKKIPDFDSVLRRELLDFQHEIVQAIR